MLYMATQVVVSNIVVLRGRQGGGGNASELDRF